MRDTITIRTANERDVVALIEYVAALRDERLPTIFRYDSVPTNDSASVRGSSFGRLQARLGAGNDKLELRNNDIGLLAFLDGQDDDDISISKNNSGTINAVNFES